MIRHSLKLKVLWYRLKQKLGLVPSKRKRRCLQNLANRSLNGSQIKREYTRKYSKYWDVETKYALLAWWVKSREA